MCGICGEIRFDGRPASVAHVERMVSAMGARGPDGSGLYQHDSVALGHRRLKIIDLSERASQPMVDAELGLAIAYNGAIYNHGELRRELEGKGYRFFSTGDTEVILKAYHAWGPDCVERLIGMFAFVVAERDTARVFMARDRQGIKPLYYAAVPGGLRFASSLPALLEGGEIDTDIDPVALHHYMTFHSVVPAPLTIVKGARKLPPAHRLTVEADGAMKVDQYWRLQFAADPTKTADDWKEEVLTTLRRAVSRRLVADVPVGVLLSGGLDSSLVVGLLAEAGQTRLNTFSIGFETVESEAGDEFQYSDVIAKRFETVHHRIFVDSRKALPSLHHCIHAMSEPMVSHDAIGFFLLSEEVARHVKVVQSGQGADEVFGGYHWYPPLMASSRAAADYRRVFFDRDHEEYLQVVHPRFHGADHSRAFVEQHFATPGAERPIDQALRLDTTVMLVDDPVKRVDNMTMAWGLEARVPFLDHEVVELAARIPAELKVSHGGKYILKEAARRVIPPEVIDRPKGYFPVPALKYLRGPFLEMVREALTRPEAKKRNLLNEDYVAALLAAPDQHLTPLRGSKLWQLGLLELWLQSHEL